MTLKQHPSTTTPTVRAMRWDDIPSILTIARETTSCWIGSDFRSVLQSNETLGFVGEQQGQVVGFALCTVHREQIPPDSSSATATARDSSKWRRQWLRCIFARRNNLPRRIHLFAVGVAPELPEFDVERMLLKRFDVDLRAVNDRLEAVVPETNVLAQAVLREAGFLAICVMSGYYLHIDGYLMARDNRTFLESIDSTVSEACPMRLDHRFPQGSEKAMRRSND